MTATRSQHGIRQVEQAAAAGMAASETSSARWSRGAKLRFLLAIGLLAWGAVALLLYIYIAL